MEEADDWPVRQCLLHCVSTVVAAKTLPLLASPQAAVQEYTAAIGLAPGDGMHRYSRGYALMELGKLRSALADATAALTIDPTDGASA